MKTYGRPVEIKYRGGQQKVMSVMANGCSGEYAQGVSSAIFYLDGKQVLKIAESRLLPGMKKVYTKLFGRPWLQRIADAKAIHLSRFDDWSSALGGYPDDTDTVYMVNYEHETWVLVCGTDTKNERAILHVMNNSEKTRRGKFADAVKKLFPGKKVTMEKHTVETIEL